MALRRWRWVWGSALAALLVAIALLPPRVPSEGNSLFRFSGWSGYAYQIVNERSQFRNDLQSAEWTQKGRLRRAILADSILKAARGRGALRSEDGVITLVYETPLSADSARLWLSAAARELALYPMGPAPGMHLVVALLSNPQRAGPGSPGASAEWGVRELLDQAASTGGCVVTVNLLPGRTLGRPAVGHDLAGKPVSRVLGACALYARFGAPGPEVSRWAVAGLSSGWWWDPLTAQLNEARRRVRRLELPRGVDWGSSPWFGEVQWVEIGCLRGAAALCLRTAGLGPEPDSPFPYYRYSSLSRTKFLAYLLATRTPAQFAAFWRSPQPAAAALGSAYAEPAGMLAMSAFEHWYTAPAPSGLWENARSLLAGLGWVGLALALSIVASRHWKTEI